MRRLLTLLTLVLLAFVLELIESPAPIAVRATMLLGFVLLGSYLAGGLASQLRLPRVSGYVLFGMCIGPFALGILSREMAAALRTIDELALALIALTAGGELRIESLRQKLRTILSISGAVMLLTVLGVMALVLVARPFTPMLSEIPLPVAAGLALLLGIWCANSSPDVTVAVINEMRARGDLTDTILGVTILKDVLVIIAFAVALSLTATLANPEASFNVRLIGLIAWEVGGALAVGGLLGWGFAFYLGHGGRRTVVATFLFTYLLVLLSHALHIELLLTAVAAGFVIENFSKAGKDLIHAIEVNGLAVFALFFAIAGAALDLGALARYWAVALVVVAVRLAATWGGARIGARTSGASALVERTAWMGLISQAGVTLGLSLLVGREVPVYGDLFVAITAAIIIFHLMIGPILLKQALTRSGEVGKGEPEGSAAAAPAGAHA